MKKLIRCLNNVRKKHSKKLAIAYNNRHANALDHVSIALSEYNQPYCDIFSLRCSINTRPFNHVYYLGQLLQVSLGEINISSSG